MKINGLHVRTLSYHLLQVTFDLGFRLPPESHPPCLQAQALILQLMCLHTRLNAFSAVEELLYTLLSPSPYFPTPPTTHNNRPRHPRIPRSALFPPSFVNRFPLLPLPKQDAFVGNANPPAFPPVDASDRGWSSFSGNRPRLSIVPFSPLRDLRWKTDGAPTVSVERHGLDCCDQKKKKRSTSMRTAVSAIFDDPADARNALMLSVITPLPGEAGQRNKVHRRWLLYYFQHRSGLATKDFSRNTSRLPRPQQ